MRLIQLEYFIKAAQLENITLAANELFISQPALSKQISQLEDELGAPLFIKDGRRIKLSPYGKRFLPYVEESLNQLKSGISEVEQMKFHLQNSIAIHLSVCSMWIPEFIQSFHQHDPSLFFSISQHRQHEPAYDYLITSELNQEDNFIPLFEEPLMLAVPKDHPLAAQESISIKDIKQQTVIGLTKHNALRQTLDSYMKQLNVKLDIAYECDDPELRIAVECHTCFDWLMPAMDSFRQHWPLVELDIVSGFHTDTVGLLLTNRADWAVVSEIEENDDIVHKPLFSYEMVGICAKDHPLANKEVWEAEDFAEQTWITYPVMGRSY